MVFGRWPTGLCFLSSGSAASHTSWSQLLPLSPSDFVPVFRGCSVPQGLCQPCPRCPTACQKLWSGEGSSISGFDSIFLRSFNFPSGLIFESYLPLFLNFENLKIHCPRPLLFTSFGSGPQNHTPRFCARLTQCLPTRPALTPPLITVLGSPRAPNCQATQAGLSHASFTNSMGAFVPLVSPL